MSNRTTPGRDRKGKKASRIEETAAKKQQGREDERAGMPAPEPFGGRRAPASALLFQKR